MTNFSLDSFTVHCVNVTEAADFYQNAFGALVERRGDVVDVDLHGIGSLRLAPGSGSDEAFPQFIVTYILPQPSSVRTAMETASHHGGQILKPAKKALFSSFSGVLRSPDGVIWKLAAASNKDTPSAGTTPQPTEITLILGVNDPVASKHFYTDLGMRTDRDYGSKYIDFEPVEGAARLCLMQRAVLAKDVGLTDDGTSGAP